MKTHYQNQKGFNLIEILIAVTIIGILSGVVSLSVGKYLDNARVKATQAAMRTISQAIISYKHTQGTWPKTLEDVKDYLNKKGDNDPFKDEWKNPYEYSLPTRTQSGTITSWGLDGQPGGGDDLVEEFK
ncbi:MAG: type II secretion system protein GspG [Candidatus Brocadiae bacterium]|nr:type II secretion system protein GspG [Candidatus Brocadiia bacterium]